MFVFGMVYFLFETVYLVFGVVFCHRFTFTATHIAHRVLKIKAYTEMFEFGIWDSIFGIWGGIHFTFTATHIARRVGYIERLSLKHFVFCMVYFVFGTVYLVFEMYDQTARNHNFPFC